MKRKGGKKQETVGPTSLKNADPHLLSILSALNPKNRPNINLNDMVTFTQKSVLTRLPQPDKSLCQSIFHEFIFTQRSFKLPVSAFIELYELSAPSKSGYLTETHSDASEGVASNAQQQDYQEVAKKKSLPRKKSRKSGFSSTQRPQALAGSFLQNARSLSRERRFFTYDSEFMEEMKQSVDLPPASSVHTSTPKKITRSPSRQLRQNSVTYYEINKKKKMAKGRQSSKKSVSPKRSVMRQQKDQSAEFGQMDFKQAFPDAKKLIEIRKAHFNYSMRNARQNQHTFD